MADSILRLKVESQEYDNKLKQAAQGLTRYADECRKVGGTLEVVEKDTLDYVKALGQMDTTSRTATGKLAEMKKAFTELSMQYKQLTDEEKQSPFGQALASSLDQLKSRCNETKKQLDSVNSELGNTKQAEDSAKGGIEGLTSALGINVKSLVGWGAAIGAGKVALDVAKDAFFSSESNIDEWGRTVEGAKGAYDVFLQTINGGNWSNFFTNLSTAVQGARDLYDSLDRLGSVKSNNQAAIAIQQQQVAQLRLMKQQGQNVDEQLKAATERLAQLQNQAVDAGKVAGNKTITETIKNGIAGANTTGVKISEGTLAGVAGKLTNRGQDAFDEYKRRYDSLTQKGLDTVQRYDSLTKSYYDAQVFNLEKLSKEDQKQYLIAKAVTDRETEIQKGIGIFAQAVQEGTAAAREQFKGNRYALQGTGGKGGSGTSPQKQAQEQVKAALLAYNQTVEKAKLEMESGLKSEAEMKKTLLSAQEQLWTAYGKAYNTYADPKYKEAQDAAAAEIVKLGGEVKTATEAQKAAEQAAREQEAAAKKLADAQTKLADAQQALEDANASGDLKTIYAAQKGVENAQAGVVKAGGNVEAPSGGVALPVKVNYTTSNMEAFTAKLKEDLSKAEVGSELFNKLTEQMSDSSAISTILGTAIQNGIEQMPFDASAVMQQLLNGDNISDTAIQGYVEALNEQLKAAFDETEWPNVLITFDADTKQIVNAAKQQEKEAKKTTESWNQTAQAVQQLGQAMQQIEDPTAKAAGTVLQAISSVALGFAQASVQAASMGPWGWVAFLAAGIAAMTTTINTMHSLTGFANGGIIPGSSMSGDNLIGMTPDGSAYGLNAQEVVLNRAQVGNLASQLEGGVGNLQLETRVGAEELIFILNNNGNRRGFGNFIDD